MHVWQATLEQSSKINYAKIQPAAGVFISFERDASDGSEVAFSLVSLRERRRNGDCWEIEAKWAWNFTGSIPKENISVGIRVVKK